MIAKVWDPVSIILENLGDVAVHETDGEVKCRLFRSAYVLVIRLMTRLLSMQNTYAFERFLHLKKLQVFRNTS